MNGTPTRPRADRPPSRARLRILLADDSATFRVATQGLLRRLGHVVDVVSDGRQALEAATGRDYDVVLMDIRMPEMDGLEATRLLRAQGADRRRPRIIAVTSDPPAGDGRWFVAAGLDDVLTKPVSCPRLAEMLGNPGGPVDPIAHGNVLEAPPDHEPAPPPGSSIEVVVDGLLCELRVWSEHEWASVPESERPVACVFYEGLGWVGAVPKIALN